MYEMKEEYYTGIELIDKEHTRLFELAEETYQLQHNEFIPDKYDQIKELLDELREYTKMHFAHEEEFMQSIGYKKMFSQKIQHNSFIKWLEEQEGVLENDDPEIQNEEVSNILKFLTDWLITHIMDLDKQIPEAL